MIEGVSREADKESTNKTRTTRERHRLETAQKQTSDPGFVFKTDP